jgi:acyl-CoA reductase-like NAD-dependent aldehyde dehydrogenase
MQIVRAYDTYPIAAVETVGAEALEAKLDLAVRSFRDRGQWLKPHKRIEVLYRLASLMEPLREGFGRLIGQEGGKPLANAAVEANRAVDGVRNAAEELRNFAGREIPMGLTAASTDWMPFAGRRHSGYGIGGIPWSMREMTQSSERCSVLELKSDHKNVLARHVPFLKAPTRGHLMPLVP